MKRRQHLSLVVDEVLTAAKTASLVKEAEKTAIKTASLEPRTDLAKDFRKLANLLRDDADDITYTDIMGAL